MWFFLLDVRLFEWCGDVRFFVFVRIGEWCEDVRFFVFVRIGEKVSDGFGVCGCAFFFFGRVHFEFFDGVVLLWIGMVLDGMLLDI